MPRATSRTNQASQRHGIRPSLLEALNRALINIVMVERPEITMEHVRKVSSDYMDGLVERIVSDRARVNTRGNSSRKD